MTDKQTPEEKARAAAYADGVLAERGHTRRALDERDAERKAHDVEQRELLRQGMEHIARAEKAERERDEARALHDDALAGQIRIVANAVRDLASADASRETQLAKRAESAEASIAALVAAARDGLGSLDALAPGRVEHPDSIVGRLRAALSDLTSAATAHDEGVRQEARAELCERVVAAEIERDELRAALAGLREVARVALLYGSDAGLTTREGQPIAEGSGPFATLRASLAATPADLAARYRAEVRRATLREAADLVDEDDRHDPHRSDWMEGRIQQSHAVALQLRALADEGEKMP